MKRPMTLRALLHGLLPEWLAAVLPRTEVAQQVLCGVCGCVVRLGLGETTGGTVGIVLPFTCPVCQAYGWEGDR